MLDHITLSRPVHAFVLDGDRVRNPGGSLVLPEPAHALALADDQLFIGGEANLYSIRLPKERHPG